MAIKTILFDFGGVIIKTPNLRWLQQWRKVTGFNQDPEISKMLTNPMESKILRDVFLGKKPEEFVWMIIAERGHLSPRMVNLVRRHAFAKFQLNKPFVRFMAELKNDYKIAILSNAGDQARKVMEEKYHLHEFVDEIIISAEEGVVKPDPNIYQIAMERLNASPETSLFLDDMSENVLAARKFGMKAEQFINTKQAIQAVRDYLEED
ncbi:MAG: HAD family phosphatase [Chloroflexota bacterium]|nr:HAD family phosphatase [Chloroflexota bacterium]